ncbi:MAG: glycosyltransferase family 4 protein [Parachlamydia sp.]|jgi:glycosyltransferase involved in cell wall biosynthesis|nr:glycosyltransferase family 4 protein [Parachlamydia sp.]
MSDILINSANPIGKKMAGPAIRSFEFAKALSQSSSVTLISPNAPEIEEPGIQAASLSRMHQFFPSAKALITQNLTLSMAWRAKKHGLKIIIDAYDPLPLEVFELFKHHPHDIRHRHYYSSLNQLIFNYQMADGIICASEKQRDLWIGFLLSLKLLSFDKYDVDSSLRNFIDVVPFGLSKTPPVKTGPGLREFYQFKKEDFLLVWGGGIWNWFDPLTLIRAVAFLKDKKPEIKLIFLGIKSPDPTVPEMAMGGKAIELARELNVLNRCVFFKEGWIPYDERHNYLLDGSIGVSTHFEHLETRFSFRTRMLDYIWAGLPILATAGDSFADLIERHDLGIVVQPRNEQQIAEGLLHLTNHPERLKQMQKNLHAMARQFYWEEVVQPLKKMIEMPRQAENRLKACGKIARFFCRQVKEKGVLNSLQIAVKKLGF